MAWAQPAAGGLPARDLSVRPAADSQIELHLALPGCDFVPNFHAGQVGPEGNGGIRPAPTTTGLQRTPCNAIATSRYATRERTREATAAARMNPNPQPNPCTRWY
jgi:hypothetical protein